jgi:effector-binding domain-containing protein
MPSFDSRRRISLFNFPFSTFDFHWRSSTHRSKLFATGPKHSEHNRNATMTTPKPSLNLTTKPETVTWPETHYVYIEKIGPFQNTARQAWGEFQNIIPAISEHNNVTSYTSLYKVGPQIYRAGVGLASEPKNLPAGLQYTKFPGGKYARFTLTGPYTNLPEASGRVFDMVKDQKLPVRDDFNIENYINDPRSTPAPDLVTQILIPIR